MDGVGTESRTSTQLPLDASVSLLSQPDESNPLGFMGPCVERARREHFEKGAGDPFKIKSIIKKKKTWKMD